MALEEVMKHRDNVEEKDPVKEAFKATVKRLGVEALVAFTAEGEVLLEGFRLGYKAAQAQEVLSEVSRAIFGGGAWSKSSFADWIMSKEQSKSPAPEPAAEEVERPGDGGAVDQGVAGPAPLGEGPLDEGPVGEGGGGELKAHSWTTYNGDRFCASKDGLTSPGNNWSGYIASACAPEILRLANREWDLRGAFMQTLGLAWGLAAADGDTATLDRLRALQEKALAGHDGSTSK